jgi:hypothetical protein
MDNCCPCSERENTSPFFIGLFFGALIGAAVAIYIYKNHRSEVIRALKTYFFDQPASPSSPLRPKVKPKPKKFVV